MIPPAATDAAHAAAAESTGQFASTVAVGPVGSCALGTSVPAGAVDGVEVPRVAVPIYQPLG